MRKSETSTELTLEQLVIREEVERDHLFFSRYFFRYRQNIKFRVNWHHELVCDELEKVLLGETENLVINVPPGSSKTELAIINFIARGLALNPRARFLHLSYSDDLALLNSQTARDLVTSDEYQALWPLKISDDTKSKKRWNVEVDGKSAGGVYATSINGQITGFRAGHMAEGFQGAILIDDPLKPDDAFSKPKLNAANRKLLTTIKSRKANPKTPIVLIMQRISDNDPVQFIKNGNVPGTWKFVRIPAVLDEKYVETLDPKYQALIDPGDHREGRFSYWPYKEPIDELLAMQRGEGTDQTGARISRHVFASQYDQNPVPIGGNIIKGEYFPRYKILPKLSYRNIYADTAQKTAERNDFSVFQCTGYCPENGKAYLIDQIRGKWEGPELKKRAIAFWAKHKAFNSVAGMGQLRKMKVEDKASGTDLIQSVKLPPTNIPVEAIQRDKDRLVRVTDATPYLELGLFCIPEDAPFTNDFVSECEAFTSDDSHAHDDQIDPMADAVMDLLAQNKIKIWQEIAKN